MFVSTKQLVTTLLLLLLLPTSHANTEITSLLNLRVLVTYTASAETYVTSQTQLKTRFYQIFAEANRAFRNSGSRLHLVPVGFLKVSDPTAANTTTLQNINSGILTTLLSVGEPLWAAHAAYQADLTTLITRFGTSCGVARYPQVDDTDRWGRLVNSGWGVTGISAISVACSTTLAHEIGHNFGLGHSWRKTKDNIGILYPRSRGYGIDGLFFTTMAYGDFDTDHEINTFSNPANKCHNLPCGDRWADSFYTITRMEWYAANINELCPIWKDRHKKYQHQKYGRYVKGYAGADLGYHLNCVRQVFPIRD